MRILALPPHERHAAWQEWLSECVPGLSDSQLSRAAQYVEEHHHDMIVHVVKELTELRRDLELYRSQAHVAVTKLLDTQLTAALAILDSP